MQPATIREAVAIFDDAERLERAVAALTENGFDRAEISLLAPEALSQHPRASTGELAGDPETPHEAAMTEPDLRQGRTLATSMAAALAGMAAAGFAVATGGAGAVVIGAAVAAAGGVGGAGALLGRDLGRTEAAHLEEQLRRGGVLLWVRLHDAAAEHKAVDILRRHCAQVSVHEYPADPRDRRLFAR